MIKVRIQKLAGWFLESRRREKDERQLRMSVAAVKVP
jgi:hypothetical protein